MPPELILPAFALTLVANALLIAAAIRALRRGQLDEPADRIEVPGASAWANRGRPSSRADMTRQETGVTPAAPAEPQVASGGGSVAEPMIQPAAQADPTAEVAAAPPDVSTAERPPAAASPAATVAVILPDEPAAWTADALERVVAALESALSDSAPAVVRRPHIPPPPPFDPEPMGAAHLPGPEPSSGGPPEPAPTQPSPPTSRSNGSQKRAATNGPQGTGAPERSGRASDKRTARGSSDSMPQAGAGTAKPARKTRRKFSMPPLEDQAKVERSIESFLSGIESSPDAAPPADAGSASTDATNSAAATTVALVAISGWVEPPSASATTPGSADSGPSRPDAAGDSGPAGGTGSEPADDPATIVERTLRGAARGSDVVEVEGPGRFRVVLSGTGELAARAYLRRIRTTVEPLLDSFERPLHLATATATVLDEPLDEATAVAARRLTAALQALDEARAASDASDVPPKDNPRASGD
jgi:hypothetical protein